MRNCVLGCILVSLFMLLPIESNAQEDDFIWVYTGDFLGNFYWSADSRQLVFAEDATSRVDMTDDHWNSYDVAAEELQMASRWPLQPTFTSQEQSAFNVASGVVQTSFIYASPNGRYLIYAPAEENPRIPAPLAVSDRQTLQTYVEPESILDPFSGPKEFSVIWAADSSAFVLRNDRGLNSTPWLIYGSDFSEDVEDTTLKLIDKVEITSTEYFVREVLDISGNGDLLLLDTGVQDPETLQLVEHHLILWDTQDEANSIVIGAWDDVTYAGAFCPSSETRVVYLNGLDLYEQEVGNPERVFLNRYAIFEEHIREFVGRRRPLTALFSPNGRLLMLHPEDPGEIRSNVYLDDLTQKNFEGSQCFDED